MSKPTKYLLISLSIVLAILIITSTVFILSKPSNTVTSTPPTTTESPPPSQATTLPPDIDSRLAEYFNVSTAVTYDYVYSVGSTGDKENHKINIPKEFMKSTENIDVWVLKPQSETEFEEIRLHSLGCDIGESNIGEIETDGSFVNDYGEKVYRVLEIPNHKVQTNQPYFPGFILPYYSMPEHSAPYIGTNIYHGDGDKGWVGGCWFFSIQPVKLVYDKVFMKKLGSYFDEIIRSFHPYVYIDTE